jgi:hypothetical protein
MFSIKAVRASGEYSMFSALQVDVVVPGVAPNTGPGVDILLFDKADEMFREMICVSNDPEEFVAAYIMNEHGKTVDAVRAPDAGHVQASKLS